MPAGPEEKSIVALWSKIPGKFNVSDMKLILGEGITDNKLSPVKTEPTGYINAASLELDVRQPIPIATLKNIDMFPYKLDVNNVVAYLNGSSSVRVNLDYNLSENNDYNVGELGHKFLIEIKDTTGKTFEKEFVPETDLKIGTNGTVTFSIDDSTFEKRKSGSFTLSIYDQFQGQKVKLATQGYYYNITNLNAEVQN
ncbi:hypothetical protein D3C71_1552430 [compost metagenome]